MIDRQQFDRRPPDRCEVDEPRSVPRKVLFPWVTTRMKQRNHLSCFRVNTRDIRSFPSVTSKATQTKISDDRSATVLPGTDVVEMETCACAQSRHGRYRARDWHRQRLREWRKLNLEAFGMPGSGDGERDE